MTGRLINRAARDYSPVSWLHYFDEAHDVCPGQVLDRNDVSESIHDSFRVYLKNFKPPHAPKRGLGHQITNSKQLEETEQERDKHAKTPTLVTLHGGGYSGLTWAQFSHYIEQECNCRILAVDLRGHGDTKTSDDDKMDINTLVEDVINVIHATHQLCGFIETPRIVLIGHSMGGAIAVKCASRCQERLPSLVGFVVIDVVEGTAKEALPLMMSVIQTRPVKFPSLANAIEWSIRSGMAKNVDAARVSMPSNLLSVEKGHLGIHDVDVDDECEKNREYQLDKLVRHKFRIEQDSLQQRPTNAAPMSRHWTTSPRVSALRSGSQACGPVGFPRPNLDERAEESTNVPPTSSDSPAAPNDSDGYKHPAVLDRSGYCWRTNLAKTQPFWNGWFDGLSEQLLNAPVQGKFLLLAGIDRLDKTLTIGQMQGKFMMKVLPKCGHAVHEDVPLQVASVISQFLIRNEFATSNTR